MKPFAHDLNLGYGLCKCKHCHRQKAKRTDYKTAMRMKAQNEAEKEAQDTTDSNLDSTEGK